MAQWTDGATIADFYPFVQTQRQSAFGAGSTIATSRVVSVAPLAQLQGSVFIPVPVNNPDPIRRRPGLLKPIPISVRL